MNRKDGQGMNSLVLKIIIFVTAVAGVGFVTYGAYTYKTNLENQAKEAATQVVVEVKDDSKTNIESVVNKALEEQEIKVDYMVREIDKQTMYITDNIIGYDGPNEADFKEKINFTENQEVQVIGVVEQYKNESCLWYLLEGRRIQDMKIKKFLELPENKDLAERLLNAWTGISSDNRNLNINFININSEIKLKWKCLEGKHYYISSIADVVNHGLYCRTCDLLKPVEIEDSKGNKKIIPRARLIGLRSIQDLQNNKEKLKNLPKNSLLDWIKANGERGEQLLREFTGIDEDGNIHRIEELTFGLGKKFYWVCQNNPNHVYPAKISSRTSQGNGCKICSSIRNGTGYEEMFLYNAFKSVIPETEPNKFWFTDEYKGGLEYDISIPYKDKFILIEYGNTFTHNKSKTDQVKRDKLKKDKALSHGYNFISILDDKQSEYPEKWEKDDIVVKISRTPDQEDKILKIVKFILNNFNISTEPLDNPKILQEIKDIAWKNSRGAGLSEERSLEYIHPILAKEILPELNNGLTARDLMPKSRNYVTFKCNHCGRIWDTYINTSISSFN